MKWCLLFLTLSLSSFTVVAQERQNLKIATTPKTLKVVGIKFTLLNSPGIANDESRWETAYELRIANEQTYYEANRQGKFRADTSDRVGELIAKGSFSRTSLRRMKNRTVVLQFPLSKEIQDRLREQPLNRVKLTASTATEENIRLSREHEKKAQVFFFYSVANFYDAKLKKNVVVPVTGIWMLARHPQGVFEIKLEISERGFNTESS